MQFNQAKLDARVKRARSAVGKGIKYKLGRGGFFATAPLPDAEPEIGSALKRWIRRFVLDCSGFIAWVCEMRRDQINAKKKWSKLLPWIETTMVHKDATGPQHVFVKIDKPVPGCLVVYGDTGKSQGHIGIVSAVGAWNPNRIVPLKSITVIDCSSGRSKATGDAIHERDGAFFLNNRKTIFAVLKEDLL